MHVTKPTFKWEWNANTMIMVVGFVFTWGVTYAQLDSGRTTNASNIERLEARLATLEGTQRTLENHELRLTTVESQARDASQTMRAVESSISALSSDIRLTREILERLERQLNGGPRQTMSLNER